VNSVHIKQTIEECEIENQMNLHHPLMTVPIGLFVGGIERAFGIENWGIPHMGYSAKFYIGKGGVIRCLIARDRTNHEDA
jgi:hypothetical protein